MGNIFNDDFLDFIRCFNKQEVEYILVGGYAVILHGYARTTGDMDIWVNKTEVNYRKIEIAFVEFGMSLFDMTKNNFLNNPDFDVFTYGRPPVSIDIMTSVKGLEFNESFKEASLIDVEGLPVRLIHYKHLVQAKKAANRPKDMNDLDNLGE